MSEENLFTPGCIRTFTGKYINPVDANVADICIEDIAHALSQQPRFGGHLPKFYSVAQHCIHVSDLLPKEFKLAGLLHDASEAYLIDVPRPVKDQLTNYKGIENGLMYHIACKYGFQWPLHQAVKEADERYLQWEWDNIMLRSNWNDAPRLLTSDVAKQRFLVLFNKLTNETP